MSKENFDYEDSMRRLDAIIKQIESGDAPLDASLALYKEGIALAADCAEKLSATEKEVVILTKNIHQMLELQPFVAMEDDDE